MALTTPGGRGMGLRLDVPRDPKLWAYPLAPLKAPPPSPIDLTGGFPFPAQDQGQEGSCTAFAGTGCLEWLLAAGDTPGGPAKLSEAFTYYVNRREDGSPPSRDTGASSQSIAKGMAQFGAAAESLMPYQAGAYSRAPSQAAYTDALGRRIVKYYQIASADLLGGLWAALSGGIVCCMGFQVPRSFETGVGASGKVPAPGPGDDIIGGHEVVACGWFPDTSAPGGLGWVMVRNSWGTGMGLSGYYLVPTVYWTSGLVMDHIVLAFDNPPSPPPPPDPPPPSPDPSDWRALVQDASDQVKIVRADPDAQWPAGTLEQADADLDEALALNPNPPQPPPPAAQFVSPLVNGAVFGKTKWLAGSLGCDLFVPRGTPVVAPADCVIEEVLGGVGISGGDELILSMADRSWSWRYRHTAATHPVGYHAKQGERVGTVGDDSLDQLGNPPAWSQPMPDKYQHLDLSVNRGTDQFSPQGGGGGNFNAYQWVVALGYQGRVLGRTPGPPDAGLSTQESIVMMTPKVRAGAS